MDGFFELSGCELVALANLVAVSLAKGLSSDELDILSNFFSAVGDNLGILGSSNTSSNKC